MPSLPQLILAMREELPAALLRAPDWARLEAVTRIPRRAALTDFATPAADALLAETEIIFACWGCPPITDDVLARAPRLRMVAYSAASVKQFVTPALWRRGILVTSAVAAMAIPVAEFTLAAILLCNKDTFRFRDQLRASRGRRGTDTRMSHDNPRIGNYRRRIGLVGASHIGRLVIGHLRRFDFDLAVSDPYLTEADAADLRVRRLPLAELLPWADVVSLHAPALPGTRHMIGARELASMRDGSWLVNTARGWLVDHDALQTELVSRRLNAFIDTPLPDPLPPASVLYDLENVVLTPHMAGAQGNELWRMAELAIEEIERFLAFLPPLHPVREQDLARIA
jgi:phosphoglycerate dehydrogenase-like enzyme